MNDHKRPEERNLTTADLAAAANANAQTDERREERAAEARRTAAGNGEEQLAPLFTPELTNDFRTRWNAVQSSFVDDPRDAVRHGDELVAQVMKTLADSFASERAKLEAQFEKTDQTSTEAMRVAFRRYRSFFERLLSL